MSMIFHSVVYCISGIQICKKLKKKKIDGNATKKNVGFQYKFPRQYIIEKKCIIIDPSAFVKYDNS